MRGEPIHIKCILNLYWEQIPFQKLHIPITTNHPIFAAISFFFQAKMISIGNTARIPDKKISDTAMGKILDKRTVLVFKLDWDTIIQAKDKLSKGNFGKQEFNLTSILLAFVNSCICIICLSSTVHNRVLRAADYKELG